MMIEGQVRRYYKDSPPVSGIPQERGGGSLCLKLTDIF